MSLSATTLLKPGASVSAGGGSVVGETERGGTENAPPSVVDPRERRTLDGAGRLLGVDIVRVLAALGIVWGHSVQSDPLRVVTPAMDLGRISTPLFAFLAAYFVVQHLRRNPRESYGGFFLHRFNRIYLPFLAWSVIYLGARVVNYVLTGKVSEINAWRWEFLWIGTTYHLWFLPFVLIAGVLSYPLVRFALATPERRTWTAVGLIVTGAAVTLLPRPEALDMALHSASLPAILYSRSPGFLWGLGAALLVFDRRGPWVKRSVAIVSALVFLASAATALALRPASRAALLEFLHTDRLSVVRLGAMLLVPVAFTRWSGPVAERVARLGRLSMGVYVSHVLFVEGALSICRAWGLTPSIAKDVGVFTFAVTAAFATSWALSRWKSTAWLVR
jgi:surface polysaccharide O-acyltransferase-like enzyme